MDDFSSPYSLDFASMDGGMMLYVRKNVPSNLLSVETKPVEGFYVELNLSNGK